MSRRFQGGRGIGHLPSGAGSGFPFLPEDLPVDYDGSGNIRDASGHGATLGPSTAPGVGLYNSAVRALDIKWGIGVEIVTPYDGVPSTENGGVPGISRYTGDMAIFMAFETQTGIDTLGTQAYTQQSDAADTGTPDGPDSWLWRIGSSAGKMTYAHGGPNGITTLGGGVANFMPTVGKGPHTIVMTRIGTQVKIWWDGALVLDDDYLNGGGSPGPPGGGSATFLYAFHKLSFNNVPVDFHEMRVWGSTTIPSETALLALADPTDTSGWAELIGGEDACWFVGTRY